VHFSHHCSRVAGRAARSSSRTRCWRRRARSSQCACGTEPDVGGSDLARAWSRARVQDRVRVAPWIVQRERRGQSAQPDAEVAAVPVSGLRGPAHDSAPGQTSAPVLLVVKCSRSRVPFRRDSPARGGRRDGREPLLGQRRRPVSQRRRTQPRLGHRCRCVKHPLHGVERRADFIRGRSPTRRRARQERSEHSCPRATVTTMRRCTATVGQLQKGLRGVRGAEAGAAFVLALAERLHCAFASFSQCPTCSASSMPRDACPGAPPGAVKTDWSVRTDSTTCVSSPGRYQTLPREPKGARRS